MNHVARAVAVSSLFALSALATAACSDDVGTPAPSPAPSSSTPTIVAPPSTPTPPTTTYSDPPTVPGDPSALPPTTTPPVPGTPGACTIQTGNPTCDQCLQQGCCAQIAACDADPDCSATDACTAQCFQQYGYNQQVEQQCEQQCFMQHPSGGQKLDALFQCLEAACPAQCPM